MRYAWSFLNIELADAHIDTSFRSALWPYRSNDRDAATRIFSRSQPDLVAISGDLTQRARITEFQSARRFLDAIPFPQIVVPGNHDVPHSEIAVSGVNTARALTHKNGRINRQQLEEFALDSRMCQRGMLKSS
jgi:predicted MPP superfamily phosphohydrolase